MQVKTGLKILSKLRPCLLRSGCEVRLLRKTSKAFAGSLGAVSALPVLSALICWVGNLWPMHRIKIASRLDLYLGSRRLALCCSIAGYARAQRSLLVDARRYDESVSDKCPHDGNVEVQ